MKKTTRIWIYSLCIFGPLLILSNGCYNYVPLATHGEGIFKTEITSLITPHEQYKLKMKGGSEYMITVDRVDQTSIYGTVSLQTGQENPDGVIRLVDILTIERSELDKTKTTILLSALAPVLVVVIKILTLGN